MYVQSLFFVLLASFYTGEPSFDLSAPEKLHEGINTSYDEIAPVVSRDGHSLYFTRVASPDFDRTLIINGQDVHHLGAEDYDNYLRYAYYQLVGAPVSDPHRSDYNQDVWVAESVSGYFDRISHPSYPLNNALPNSICAFTSEPNEFIIINQFPESGGLQNGFSTIRRRQDGSWTQPKPLKIRDYYTDSKGVSLTMSTDEKVLILSLKREDTQGASDLYICFREGPNQWSIPQNMGQKINSPGKETHPSLSEDMQLLFFSSTRPGSQGTDIYFCRRLGEGWDVWSEPQRLPEPINTSFNDGYPHYNQTSGYLYFASSREGNSDIYRVRLQEPEEQKEVMIRGRLINSVTGFPIKGDVHFEMTGEGYYRNFYLSEDGYFRILIPKGKPIEMLAEKDGYISTPYTIYLDPKQHYYGSCDLDFMLDPLQEGAKISLDPIYFERSKAVILAQSEPALQRLLHILEIHPELEIRIEGHTDNVGNPEDLQKLSEQRAQAVKNYLAKQGISKNRIKTIGFGGRFPLNDNSTEELRKQNRRVVVRIVNVK